MKKRWLFAVMALLVVVLAACGEKEYKPKAINPETDVCKVCNMSITHANYAGQIVLKNNDHLIFDDLGCLVEYLIENGEDEVGAAFIVEESSHRWINVKDAVYVYNKDFWTPMSYGVLAFDTEEGANEYMEANGQGELLSYDDLFEFNWGVHVH